MAVNVEAINARNEKAKQAGYSKWIAFCGVAHSDVLRQAWSAAWDFGVSHAVQEIEDQRAGHNDDRFACNTQGV